MRMLFLSLISFTFIITGFAYALNVVTSQPWHTAQQIVNSCGRVFDDEGRAYLCDSVNEPTSISDVGPGPTHSIQYLSKSATDMESIDSDNNGWPDVGIGLVGSSTPSQPSAGTVSHDISQIRRGVSGAQNQNIDSNNNGWPDKCDNIPGVSIYTGCEVRCAQNNDVQCEAGETRVYLYGSGYGCTTDEFDGVVEGVPISCEIETYYGTDRGGDYILKYEQCTEGISDNQNYVYCSDEGLTGFIYHDEYDSSCAICCASAPATWHLVWERSETYGGWCQDDDANSPWYNCNQLGSCVTDRGLIGTTCEDYTGYSWAEGESCSDRGITCFDCWGTYGQFVAWIFRCE